MTADWAALAHELGPQHAAYMGPHRKGTYRQRERARLAADRHPATNRPLLPAPRPTCLHCRHCVASPNEKRRGHFKCATERARWTPGRATEVLQGWPACSLFVASRVPPAKGSPDEHPPAAQQEPA